MQGGQPLKKVGTYALFVFVLLCFVVASLPYLRSESSAAPYGTLELHFIDVGQGDAVLIVCDGHAMLIDGGTPKNSNRIYTYLKKHEVDSLDYIIATHPHDDHVGGLAGALNAASAKHAFCSVQQADGRAFQSFLKYLNEQGTELAVPSPGDRYSLGSASFVFIGPLQESANMNDNSLVLRLSYGSFHALFTGDAETAEEGDILVSNSELRSTLLKVGHHGSANATSQEWVNAIRPQYAVISCGKNNEYGHPSQQTLSRLENIGCEVLRTDLSGDIVVTVKPDGSASCTAGTQNASVSNMVTYIVNLNSGKFHDPSCPSAADIRAENRLESNQDRDTLIAQGFHPCGRCNP